jgi:hypothetical protein
LANGLNVKNTYDDITKVAEILISLGSQITILMINQWKMKKWKKNFFKKVLFCQVKIKLKNDFST